MAATRSGRQEPQLRGDRGELPGAARVPAQQPAGADRRRLRRRQGDPGGGPVPARARTRPRTTIYTSNVEQYLFQNDAWQRYYTNVATLPIDNNSTFIRAYFNMGFRFPPGSSRPTCTPCSCSTRSPPCSPRSARASSAATTRSSPARSSKLFDGHDPEIKIGSVAEAVVEHQFTVGRPIHGLMLMLSDDSSNKVSGELRSAGFMYKSLRPFRCDVKATRPAVGIPSSEPPSVAGSSVKRRCTSARASSMSQTSGFPATVRMECSMIAIRRNSGTPTRCRVASGPPTVAQRSAASVEPRQQARLSRGCAIGNQPAH